MKPYIGAVVHYVSRGSADGVFPSVCRAALVTEVHSDELVSLAVLNPAGLFFDGTIAYSTVPLPGTWHWPEQAETQAVSPAPTPQTRPSPALPPRTGGSLSAGTTTTAGGALMTSTLLSEALPGC